MPVEEIISTTGLQTKGAVGRNLKLLEADGLKASSRPDRKARPDEVVLSDDGFGQSEYEKNIESLMEYSGWGNFKIDFATDDETGSVVIMIIDQDTGETLRQIPPEQILNLRSHLKDMIGLVFDQMA